MANKILMPALSPTMTEGTLTKWLVKIGDNVKAGDILAEIETDKATMEVEAVDEGKITKILIKKGTETIPVNSVLAILDGDSDELDDEKIENIKKITSEDEKETKDNIDKNVLEKKNQIYESKSKINNSSLYKRTLASPFVKKFSKDNNIKLSNIKGSGPNGRIIKRDLKKNYDDNHFNEDKHNIILPSSMRKIIAERTTLTKQTVPHFYLTIDSNVDKLLELRKKINEKSDIKISINDILVKALAYAQELNPLTNVSWVNEKIIKHNSIDVSIAVALKEGLVTPIVRNASKKGIKEISIEIKNLVEKSKNGKLLPEEYLGGSISISNLGMFGITEFSAIINPPQSSIVAVGAIKKIPYVVDNEICIVNILKSTLSADHRVLDGAVAGKLLKDFNDVLENPFVLWLNSNDMEII
jgi:pyruvate dehydrogenase E2 component (dihydrolipoamide acetyltransferase)